MKLVHEIGKGGFVSTGKAVEQDFFFPVILQRTPSPDA
jgi:hypothetical protein